MSDHELEPKEPGPATPKRGDGLAAVGPQFILRLSALIRIGRIHDVSNEAFKRQLDGFMEVLAQALKEETEIAVVVLADYLYLNGNRIKADSSILSVYHVLMAEFERRSLGGIRFHQGVTQDEIVRFFRLFMAAEDGAGAETLFEALSKAKLTSIQPVAAWEVESDGVTHRLDERTRPSTEHGAGRQVFWRSVSGTRTFLLNASQTGRPDLRHAKRLVQPIVDSIMKHEYSIVGMTALKNHDEYTYAHCVNVSILSVSMGNVLGFPRQTLADLGVAALMHDIGKIMVPADVLQSHAKLSDEQWRLMRRHPIEGMKMILRMPGLSMLAVDSMRTCLEHHMNVNFTGYPKAEKGWELNIMSRIVAMADVFDAMTAHRAYQKRPFTPFETLRHLAGANRAQFDPTVLWALLKSVGLYPPGSILATDSGHIVLAMIANPLDPRRPSCRVLVEPDGTRLPMDRPVNWEPMGRERRVIRVMRPEDVGIDPAEYLNAA
jgi:HD-GYP domain-containing protein (c-di-GMP phosphodiesterase class II)